MTYKTTYWDENTQSQQERDCTLDEVSEIEARKVQPPPVTFSVSPRQIRQALTAAGLRASVEAAITAGDQDTKDWYEFSTAFERNHPRVAAMGTALGVSVLDMDNLWTLAGTL